MLEILEQTNNFPGPRQRTQSVRAFQASVDRGDFGSVVSRRLVRASRAESLAKWKQLREENPSLTDKDIRTMQRREANERKKAARKAFRDKGVNSRGKLNKHDKWRVLEMGDSKEEVWKNKLSFVPTLKIGKFGAANLAKLQNLQERLVEQERLEEARLEEKRQKLLKQGKLNKARRLRGGAAATATKKHQKGRSFGRTVLSGARQPRNPQERSANYSGTIQLKQYKNDEMQALQEEVTATLTDCIEEAFGHVSWYQTVKEVYENVPSNRGLPNSSLPASNIWWNWNMTQSVCHVDTNTAAPCFILTPYTYNGAELLCGTGATPLKVPLKAGEVVGGCWQRFPHCNDKLLSDERYSFVVYFDTKMLDPNYWIR